MIVLNKTDLVTPEELAEVEARIRAHQPLRHASTAPSAATCRSTHVLDRGAFDLDRILELDPDFLESTTSTSTTKTSRRMSFEVAKPIDPREVQRLDRRAACTTRAQTCCAPRASWTMPARDRRFAFQAVHMIADGDFIGPWKDGDPRAAAWSSSAATSTARSCVAASNPAKSPEARMSQTLSTPKRSCKRAAPPAMLDAYVVGAAFERGGEFAAFALGDGSLRIREPRRTRRTGRTSSSMTAPSSPGVRSCAGLRDRRRRRRAPPHHGDWRIDHRLADLRLEVGRSMSRPTRRRQGRELMASTLCCAAGRQLHVFDAQARR